MISVEALRKLDRSALLNFFDKHLLGGKRLTVRCYSQQHADECEGATGDAEERCDDSQVRCFFGVL